jgi:FkbH-like protein
MVLIDDSEFETNLIKSVLPEVEVIHTPEKKFVEFRDILASCGWFETLTLSKEDKTRGSLYRAEIQRKKLQEKVVDMKTYYKSLDMELEIKFVDDFSLPRASQLTQKTNQFNLTTKRYSEVDIKEFADSEKSDVVYLRLKDRFGDTGIVGLYIIEYKGKSVIIDTLLLSCRVLGRGVEDAFLINLLKYSKKRGYKSVIGKYIPTLKNSHVVEFYSKRGFTQNDKESTQEVSIFNYDLKKEIMDEPDFFLTIDSDVK